MAGNKNRVLDYESWVLKAQLLMRKHCHRKELMQRTIIRIITPGHSLHIHCIYYFINLCNKEKWVILSGFYSSGNWSLEKILVISPFLLSLIPLTITKKKQLKVGVRLTSVFEITRHSTSPNVILEDFNDKSLPPDHMSGPSESFSQILKAYAKSQGQQWWGWVIWKQHLTGSSVLVNSPQLLLLAAWRGSSYFFLQFCLPPSILLTSVFSFTKLYYCCV